MHASLIWILSLSCCDSPDGSWPPRERLALAAVEAFHKNVNGRLLPKLLSATTKLEPPPPQESKQLSSPPLLDAPMCSPDKDFPTSPTQAPSDVPKLSPLGSGEKGGVCPTLAQLYRLCPPTNKAAYKGEAHFGSVLFVLLKRAWLTEGAFEGASLARDVIGDLNPDWKALVVHVPRLTATDFSDLRLPRLGYADQTEIDKKRV